MVDEICVGLIGYGMAARTFHVPVIQSVPHLRLTKVVTRHHDPALDRAPSVEVVQDAATLLQDEAIHLVVIATPNRSHFELASQSLLANKHVVVEKPFTTSSAQAQQLIDLARKQNRLISVHHNRRWDGDFQTVKQLLSTNLLGRLVEYEAHYDRFRNFLRPNAWREEAGEGSGILFDLGSHLIDQAQVLFGLPQMVTADLRVQRDFAQAIDNFDLTLHYNGLKVILKGGMLVRGQEPHFILHGSAGSFVKYGMDPQEEALKRGLTPAEPGWGEEPKERWGMLNTQIDGLHVEGQVETLAGSYQAYYQNVADAIAGRAELAVKPEEARDTIRIIELAMQSNEQKCTLPLSV
ncbi:oxidoreductase [Nodosilinea sp. FACHB-13]|uniref:oxidoreductase n=1 Tax=Cyanophyceae TaxID=3028117 RepID=UPI001681D8CB|nr:oxidoreductase [Nodosilinea sp. FACHB-13]MBD2106777.1 oxidoreductase [Nodosilinea sp. FACHB-13]